MPGFLRNSLIKLVLLFCTVFGVAAFSTSFVYAAEQRCCSAGQYGDGTSCTNCETNPLTQGTFGYYASSDQGSLGNCKNYQAADCYRNIPAGQAWDYCTSIVIKGSGTKAGGSCIQDLVSCPRGYYCPGKKIYRGGAVSSYANNNYWATQCSTTGLYCGPDHTAYNCSGCVAANLYPYLYQFGFEGVTQCGTNYTTSGRGATASSQCSIRYWNVSIRKNDGTTNLITTIYTVKTNGNTSSAGGDLYSSTDPYDQFTGSLSSGSTVISTAPTRTGYTYGGIYSTSAASGGTQYINTSGALTSNGYTNATQATANKTWYARWTPKIYTINLDSKYYASSTATGVTPTTSTATPIYLKYNTGWYSNSTATTSISSVTSPTYTGYVFRGFYTEKVGGGTKVIDENGNILSGNTTICTNDSGCTLYAYYKKTYTVTFRTGTTILGTQTFVDGEAQNLTLAANLSAPFTNYSSYGWTFYGWATSVGTTIRTYTDGQSVTRTSSGSLYGIWRRNITFKYYNSATATSLTTDTGAQSYYATGKQANGVTSVSTYPLYAQSSYGWSPLGWTTSTTGTTVSISQTGSTTTTVSPTSTSSVTSYYALYSRTATLAYNGNGSTGGSTANTTGTQYYNCGSSPARPLSLTLAANGFSKTGYLFSKWAAGSTSGSQYSQNTSFTLLNTAWASSPTYNMYAIWTPNITHITLDDNYYESSSSSEPSESASTNVVPTELWVKYNTGFYPTSADAVAGTNAITNLTTKPEINQCFSFGGFWTGKAGTGTQTVSAGDIALLVAGKTAHPSDTDATWYAYFSREGRSITTNKYNGSGSCVTSRPCGIEYVFSCSLYRSNSALEGWCTNSDLTENCALSHTIPASDMSNRTFYAKWSCNSGYYKASNYVCSQCGSNSSTSAGNTASTCTCTTPGYTADGTPTGAMTSTSGCSAIQTTVTLSKNHTDTSGYTAGTTSVTATYDAAMPSATMPTRTGYTFAGYYDTNATSGGNQYYTAAGESARTWNKTSNTTLYARWTADSITCSAGYYLEADDAICHACPAGKYCTGGTWTYDGTDKGINGNVSAGYYAVGGCKVQTPTTSSDYISGGACGLIAAGYYGAAGATSSSGTGMVSGGYYSTGGGTSATPTANGNGCVGTGNTCGKLSAEYYGNGGSTSNGATCISGRTCGTCNSNYRYNTTTGKTAASQCKTQCSAGTAVQTANNACSNITTDDKYTDQHVVNYGSTSTISPCPTNYHNSGTTAAAHAGIASCKITCSAGSRLVTANDGSCTPITSGNVYMLGHSVSYGSVSAAATSCPTSYTITGNTQADHNEKADCKISCDAGTAVLSTDAACSVVGTGKYKTGTASVSAGSVSPTASDITSGWAAGTVYSCPTNYSTNGTAASNHDARTDCVITCAAGTQMASANGTSCTTPSGSWYTSQHTVAAGSTSGSSVNSCATGYSTPNTTVQTDHDSSSDCTANSYTINYQLNGGTAFVSDYTPVQYIRSNGSTSSYIDTGYSPTSLTKTEAIIKSDSGAGNRNVWGSGASNSDSSAPYALFVMNTWNNGQYEIQFANLDGGWPKPEANTTARNVVFLSANEFRVNDELLYAYFNQNGAIPDSGNKPFYLFQRWRNPVPNVNNYVQVYGFRIYEGNTLKRNMIPVRRSDNKCGMYDTVYGTFYGTSGTFTCPENSSLPTSRTYGTAVTVNGIPFRAHSIFEGWCLNPALTSGCNTDHVIVATGTSDQTFYAKWSCEAGYSANSGNTACNPNTITLNWGTDHGTAPAATSCTYGTKFTTPAALTASGYSFKGWERVGNNDFNTDYTTFGAGAELFCTEALLSVTSGSVTFNAKWAPIVHVTLNNHGATTAGTTEYWYEYQYASPCYFYTSSTSLDSSHCMGGGTGYTITKPTKTGYTFAGYYTGEDGAGTQYVNASGTAVGNLWNTVSSDSTLHAKWTGNTFTVTYAGNGNTGGTVPSNHTCSYGSACTAGTQGTLLKTNSTFNGWTVTCKKSDNSACTPSVSTVAAGGSLQNVTAENGATITLTARWTSCSCGSDTNASCAVSGVSNNTCQYTHTCTTGYYNANNGVAITSNTMTCTACGTGKYCPSGAQSPTSCPAASDSTWTVTTDTTTASSYNSCYEYQTPANCASGSVKRTADSASHYSNTITLRSVLSANAGYFASNTATSCSACPTNWTSNAGATANTQCYRDVILNKNGASSGSSSLTLPSNSGCKSLGTGTGTNSQTLSLYYNTACTFPVTTGMTISNTVMTGGWDTSSSNTSTNRSITVTDTAATVTYYAGKSACTACSSSTPGATCSLSVVNNVCTYTTSCTTAATNAGYSLVGGGTSSPYCRVQCAAGKQVHTANQGCATPNNDGYNWGWYTNASHYVTYGQTSGTNVHSCNTGYSTPNTTTQTDHDAANDCTANTYSISYTMNGGNNYSGAPTSYTYGTGATINGTPTRTGYTFTGWTGSNGSTAQTTVTIGTTAYGNKSYTANWSVNSYTCNPGQYLNGTTCTTCTAGNYCEGGTFTYNGGVQGLKNCATEIATGWTSLDGASAKTQCYYPVTLDKNGFSGTISADAGTGCKVLATATGTNPATLRLYYNTACTLPTFSGWTHTGYTNASAWSTANTLNGGTVTTTISAITSGTPSVTTYYARKTTCAANYYKANTTTCSACGSNSSTSAGNSVSACTCTTPGYTANGTPSGATTSTNGCSPIQNTITLNGNGATTAANPSTLYTTYNTNVYKDSERSNAMTTSTNNITVPARVRTVTYNGNSGTVGATTSANTTSTGTFGGFYSTNTSGNGTGTQYINANGYITAAGLTAGKGITTTAGEWFAKWTQPSVTLPNATRGSGSTWYTMTGWWTATTNGTKCGDIGGTYTPSASETLYAQWSQCTCTPGTNVTSCTVTGVTNNKCQYSYTCATGYNNGGATSGTFEGVSGTGAATSPSCGTGDTYTVTYACGTRSGGTPPSNGTATYGAGFTPAAKGGCYKEGYSFAGWKVFNTGTPGDIKAAETEFTWNYTEDKTFTAQWNPNTITVVYNNGGHGTAPASTTCVYDTTLTLPAAITDVTPPTHTFNKWNVSGRLNYPDGSLSDINKNFTAEQTIACTGTNLGKFSGTATVTATWTANTYTISYVLDGGTYTGGPDTYTYGVGAVVSAGTPTRANSYFDKWCTDAALTSCANSYDISTTDYGNKTYYAKWGCYAGYHLNGNACEVNSTTITLSSPLADSHGTTTLYVYAGNAYLDAAHTQLVSGANGGQNHIVIPTRTGYTFAGYKIGSNRYIEATGYLNANGLLKVANLNTSETWNEIWNPGCNAVHLLVANGTNDCASTELITLYKTTDSAAWSTDHNCSTKYPISNLTSSIALPTKQNAAFNGFYTTNVGTSPLGTPVVNTSGALSDSWTVNQETSIYAHFGCNEYYQQAGIDICGACQANVYNISYDMHGGTNYNNAPTQYEYGVGATIDGVPTHQHATFDSWCDDAELTHCGPSFTISSGTTGDMMFYAKWTCDEGYGGANCTINSYDVTVTPCNGISAVAAASGQTGWAAVTNPTGIKKSYTYGSTINMTNVINPTRKNGYTGIAYTKSSGAGSMNNNTFTVGAGNATICADATGISAPATATISVEYAEDVYNYETIAVTAGYTMSPAYDSGITVSYKLGVSTTSGGTYTYGSSQTSNTFTIAKNSHYGAKYYKIQAIASDGTLSSSATTSSAASVTLKNVAVTFDATQNGGTLSGTSPLYVAYDTATVYTTETGTTSGTVPTATKTGHTFKGWYTAETGGAQVYNASGVLQASVSGYTNASSKWVITSAKTLYAQWTANTYTIEYVLNGGTHGATHPDSATFNTAFTVSNPTRSGYTFAGWKITGMDTTTHTIGTETNTSNAVAWTKETNFKNLRASSGIVTFTAQWCANCDAGGGASCSLVAQGTSCTYTTACTTAAQNAGYNLLVNSGTNNPYCRTQCDAGTRVTTANEACSTSGNGWYSAQHYVNYGSVSGDAVQSCPAESGISITADMLEQGGITDANGTNADNMSNRVRINKDRMIRLNAGTYSVTFGNNVADSSGYTIVVRGFYPYSMSGDISSAIHINGAGTSVIRSGANITLTEPTYVRIVFQKSNASAAITTEQLVAAQPVLTKVSAYTNSGTNATDHDNINDCKISCAAGTYVETAGGACVSADAGNYAAGGSVSYGSTSNQSICSGNTYAPVTGMSSCTACASGYSISGTTAENHDQQADCKKTISLNKNGGSGTISGVTGTTAASLVCSEAVACNLPSASGLTQGGYTFAATWSATSGTGASGCVSSATTPTAGTYYACKNTNNYTITYALNGGTHGATHPDSYNIESSDITISNPTKTGYTFNGWTVTTAPTAWGTGSSSSGATNFKIATGTYGNIALSAVWTANTNTPYVVNHYTKDLGAVTYTLAATDNLTGTTDSSVTLANLKKTTSELPGFTYSEGFAGTAATGANKPTSGAVTTTTILANGTRVINLYYDRDTHTVSLQSGTGIASTTGAGTYEYGATVNIDATVSNGYTWSKWVQTSNTATTVSATKAYSFVMGTSDVDYTATTNGGNTITLIFANGGHGGTAPTTPSSCTYGSTFTMPAAMSEAGYTFGKWNVNGHAFNGGQTNVACNYTNLGVYSGSATITASWTANNYEITLSAPDATAAGTTKIYTTHDTNVYLNSTRTQVMSTSNNPITIPTRTGYVFKGYYSASSNGTQYIAANGKITANGVTDGKGYTANATWYAQWTVCAAGTYWTNGSCLACAEGSYTATTGQTACSVCTNGTTTDGTGKTSCNIACPNASNVSNWATPTWDAASNTVSNRCDATGCAVSYGFHESDLPAGYTLLEYIKGGNSASYINTGIVPSDDMTMDVVWYTNNAGSNYLSGARQAAGTPIFFAQSGSTGNHGVRGIVGNEYVDASTNGTLWTRETSGQKYHTVLTANNGSFDYYVYDYTNNKTFTTTKTYPLMGTVTPTMHVFAFNSGNVTEGSDVRIYSYKLTKGGIVVFNGIPAKNASNVAGLYDTVSGQFFASATNTQLTAGPVTTTAALPYQNYCSLCSAGSFCLGGTDAGTECALGSYSAAGASACTACQDGTTTSGTGATSCDAICSNASAGVASWNIASWTNNTVADLCSIASYNSYTISYTMNGGTNYTGAPISYTYNTGVTINGTPTHPHATFAGWTGDNGSVPQQTVVISPTSLGDKAYVANWNCNTGYTGASCEADTFFITFDNETNDQVSNSGFTGLSETYGVAFYKNNTSQVVTALPQRPLRVGYLFGGYYTGHNGSGTQIIDETGAILVANTYFTADATIYAKWIEAPYIEITTTSLPLKGEYSFALSAAGYFYVNTQDTTTVINKTNTNEQLVTVSANQAGPITVRLYGLATAYNSGDVAAVRFGRDDSALAGVTYAKFANISGSLGGVFPTISAGTLGTTQPKFINTFAGCVNWNSTIPANLFSGLTGTPIAKMFKRTFAECTGLTGTIPAGLFAGVSGTPQISTFEETFVKCSGLTGYIPRGLLSSFANAQSGRVPENTHTNMFVDSGLATECPCGMRQYTTYFENMVDDKVNTKVSCEVGVKNGEMWYNNKCTTACESGVTRLKTSSGIDLPLLKHKLSSSGKDLAIKHGNTVCWVPLESGNQSGTINTKVGNTVYHAASAGTTAPVAFSGLADGVLPVGYTAE